MRQPKNSCVTNSKLSKLWIHIFMFNLCFIYALLLKCPRECTLKVSMKSHPSRWLFVDKNVHEMSPKNVHEKSPQKCPRNVTKNVHEMSPKKRTSRGQRCQWNVTKSVHEMSPLLSTRCHLLCPRDVCHPTTYLTPNITRNLFTVIQIVMIANLKPPLT